MRTARSRALIVKSNGIAVRHPVCSSLFLLACITGTSYSSPQSPANIDFIQLENETLNTKPENLDSLEHKIAQWIQNEPSSPEAHYLMSLLMVRQYVTDPGETSYIRQSAELATQAYELAPKKEYGIVSLATLLEVTGEYEKALALLKEAENKFSLKSWRLDFARGRILAGLDNQEEALKFLKSSLNDKSANKDAIAPYILTTMYQSSIDSTHLHNDLAEMNAIFNIYDFGLALARLDMKAGKNDLALKRARELVSSFPDRGEAKMLMAQISLDINKRDSKAKDLLKSIKTNSLTTPQLVELYNLLAIACIHQGELAIDFNPHVKRAIELSQNPEKTVIRLAKETTKARGDKATVELLQWISTEVPGISMTHALQGEMYSQSMMKPQDAMKAYSDAIALDPSRSAYFTGRGLARFALNSFELALRDFELASEMDPTDGVARYNQACALAVLGRKNEAIEALSTAINLQSSLAENAITDKDLISIRNLPAFSDAIRLRSDSPDELAH